MMAIKQYLDKRAAEDPQFAAAYAKPAKSLGECFSYILGEAKKRGTQVCMTDEEVFGLAVHYYDEDNIKISRAPAARVSRTAPATAVDLTEEEKAAARDAARKSYEQQCLKEEAERAEARRKAEAEKKAELKRQKQELTAAMSLFDFDEV